MNTKQRVVNRLEGKDTKIHQKKIAKNVTDSFFYDGEIASAIAPDGTQLSLIATGDNRINIKDDSFRNSNITDAIDKYKLTDSKLRQLEEKGLLTRENNNWYEVTFSKDGYGDSDIGEVVYDYDSAIQLLDDYIEDERFK